MGRKRKPIHPDDPLLYPDHPRPVSRRDFVRQGMMAGGAVLTSGGILSLFSNPQQAHAALSQDIIDLANNTPGCQIGGNGSGKIPIICFDLAGGANIAGSNVLVGTNTQTDPMSEAAYTRLGLPTTDLRPDTNPTKIDTSLGLAFHADSAMLAGIRQKASGVFGNVDGIVIPARSDNDTANNPHNPMYGLARAGVLGSVTSLIGSRNSDSGGNSVAPIALMNPEYRPVKVDRPSDVTGMIDTGDLTSILSSKEDVTAVMEAIARLSHKKLGRVNTKLTLPVAPGITRDDVVKELVRCGYLSAADLADRFAGDKVNPDEDPEIVMQPSPNIPPGKRLDQPLNLQPIFSRDDFDNDAEFRKTASVMKMVIDGYAGAGTITMGGYDYHTGDRAVGERRDFRAGQCIGACLDYARRKRSRLIIYCFSDGSVSSNGRIDNTTGGGGKGEWTSDNSSTAASFMLVYHPTEMPALVGPYATTRQIGRFSPNGAVDTNSSPAANNVNLLVNTVLLNYMALNGDTGNFADIFTNLGISHGLGSNYMNYRAFNPLPVVPPLPPV